MPISLSQIPAGFRIPLYYVEVDPSKAGLPINRLPALLVGIKLATGTAAVNVPLPISSQAQADASFGPGSHLARMFAAYFANNFTQETWGLPIAEGTTAAAGSITVSSPPTAAGTLHLYIAGRHVPVAVQANDTVGTVATSIGAAITADTNLPVVKGTVSAGLCPVTCKWKGTSGNDIIMSDNFYGPTGGELMPT